MRRYRKLVVKLSQAVERQLGELLRAGVKPVRVIKRAQSLRLLAARGGSAPADRGRREAADHRHGVCRPTRGAGALDRAADRGGGREAETDFQNRTGKRAPVAPEPRPEAVAGKKCGASPNWTRSTSPRWRTCWRSM